MATLSQTEQPVATVVGTSGYTVPDGRWAKVFLNAVAVAKLATSALTGNSSVSVSGSSKVGNKEIILKAGDVITSVLTNASGTHSASTTLATQSSSESSVVVSVNGVAIFSVRAPISTQGGTGGAGSVATYTGTTAFGFLAAEYINTF